MQLIGDYSLESINGFMGANTMLEIYPQNGPWLKNISMISDGERVPNIEEVAGEQTGSKRFPVVWKLVIKR